VYLAALWPLKLALFSTGVIAIVPAQLRPVQTIRKLPQPPSARWVRGSLIAMAAGLVMLFGLALWLKPYDPDGRPLRMETHRQLGLPECTFYRMTGLPCPSCGLTTSFALWVRADLWNSLRANAVGTLMAAGFLALIPWSLVSAARGKLIGVRSWERTMTALVAIFLVLLLGRWLIVLGLYWICDVPF
jgi:hypothetical protein